jgi:hypothetical protein
MLRKASEVRFHSDEQVQECIDKALELAFRPEVPEAFREPVFAQAVGLYAQKHLEFEQVTLSPNGLGVPRG